MGGRGKEAAERIEPMKYKPFIVLLMFLSLSMYAEEGKPDSVELEIPSVIIEIDHDDKQDFAINIPEVSDLVLPEFGLDLPDPADISVKELPLDPVPLPVQDSGTAASEASFFSEGDLGFGTDNQLTGYLRLFKLGRGIRYSILFSHFSMDGYGDYDAGKGFFNREELFKGSFLNETDNFSYTGEGSVTERENGLQEQSALYSSVVHRFKEASFGVKKTDSAWEWGASASVKSAEKVLSGSTPGIESTVILNPGAYVSYKYRSFKIAISGGYMLDYRSSGEAFYQDISSTMKTEYHFPSIDISAEVSAEYVIGAGFCYPFTLAFTGAVSDIFRFSGSGGLRMLHYDNYSLWYDFPFGLSQEGNGGDWFGLLELRSIISPSVSVYASGEWNMIENSIGLVKDRNPDPVSGLFEMSDPRLYENLYLSAGADFSVSERMSVNAEWKGQFLADSDPLLPIQEVSADCRYSNSDSGIDGAVTLMWPIYPFEAIPGIGGNVSFSLNKGISLVVETADILSALTGEKRELLGPYLKPPGEITVRIKITL